MIGEMVADALKSINHVAYVRFASVYREFTDLNSFIEEISRLLEKEEGRRI
jgi:transcriptional repressor NrdR